MNDIFIDDLAKIAVYLRHKEEREAQEALEKQQRKQREEQLRLEREEEAKRIQHLDMLLSQWYKAQQLREFVKQVQASEVELMYSGMTKQQWLTWLTRYMEQIDPFRQKL